MRPSNTLLRPLLEPQDAAPVALVTAQGHAAETQLDMPSVTDDLPGGDDHPRRFELKVAVDFVLAAVLFVLAMPVMLAAAALIKLTSRGPALYTQNRVGLNGREFRIYKLRTMRHNCEAVSGVRWASAGDPRITRVGAFLRDTHLDELPQLWNVLRGDMALVGPRPERPEFVTRLVGEIPGYAERLTVRPGVTGLAQVQLPADTCLESVRLKLAYDVHYIAHAGLWLDVRLMLCTGLKMLHVPFGVSKQILRIPAGLVGHTSMAGGGPAAPARPRSAAGRSQPSAPVCRVVAGAGG